MASPRPVVQPGPLEPLRIGVYTDTAFGRPASAESQAAVAEAARLCEALGHHVEWVAPPPLSGRALSQGFFALAGSAVAGICEMMSPLLGRPVGAADFEPFTGAVLTWFEGLSGSARAQAQADLDVQAEAMRGFLASVDVALCPTLGGDRLRLGDLDPTLPYETLMARTEELAGFTAVHNPAGAPAMSVPLGWADGLPVGVQFAARPGRDALLFRLAYQLEAAAPWGARRAL